MTALQLNPPIEVVVPGKGHAWAVLHIDYGPGINGVFLCIIDDSRAFVYVDAILCKAAENLAYGFPKPNML